MQKKSAFGRPCKPYGIDGINARTAYDGFEPGTYVIRASPIYIFNGASEKRFPLIIIKSIGKN